MKRRDFLAISSTVLFIPQILPASTTRPNILIILADDMGFSDPSFMGGDAETPYLDELAKNGVLFTQFYNNAKCAPSRASLMTGMTNHRTGAQHGAGNVTDGAMTIAEALQGTYTNLMIDKWHIKPNSLDLGFERYFGSPLSAVFFWPTDKKTQSKMKLDDNPYTEKDMNVPLEEWYLTIEDTDYAIKFLEEEVVSKGKKKSFFMYYASHAPHWPLQALRKDIKRFIGKFDEGTDAAREKRYQRMIKSGIVDPKTCQLAERNDKQNWKDLKNEDKEYYKKALAIHMAMVYRMDQELGRLFKYLKANDLFDNTLIFFMSDNGASGEGDKRSRDLPEGRQLGDRDTLGRIDGIGAGLCNTPFRGAKSTLREGGIGTPFVVHWPAGIGNPGRKTGQVGHLYDIFPTILDVTGIKYPKEYDGRKLKNLDGKSLMPAIKGNKTSNRTLYWCYEKWAAMRKGKWKAIQQRSRKPGAHFEESNWELYDMNKDRSEMNNLAGKYPELTKEMHAEWKKWSAEVGAEKHKNKKPKKKKK